MLLTSASLMAPDVGAITEKTSDGVLELAA
jgi:hypothetical protein